MKARLIQEAEKAKLRRECEAAGHAYGKPEPVTGIDAAVRAESAVAAFWARRCGTCDATKLWKTREAAEVAK